MKTTERYMHPRRAAELADHVTRAVTPAARTPDVETDRLLLESLLHLPAHRRQALLAAASGKPASA
jgi:hypothetical protein